jgi:hypothetical protein
VLSSQYVINPLNAELNPICHLLALLGGATLVVVSKLRVKQDITNKLHIIVINIIYQLVYLYIQLYISLNVNIKTLQHVSIIIQIIIIRDFVGSLLKSLDLKFNCKRLDVVMWWGVRGGGRRTPHNPVKKKF